MENLRDKIDWQCCGRTRADQRIQMFTDGINLHDLETAAQKRTNMCVGIARGFAPSSVTMGEFLVLCTEYEINTSSPRV